MLKMQLPGRGDQGSNRANDILHKFPFSLPYSGGVDRGSGTITTQGVRGRFWSTESSSDINARYLIIFDNHIYPYNGDAKTYGFSVRCAIKGSTYTSKTLQ